MVLEGVTVGHRCGHYAGSVTPVKPGGAERGRACIPAPEWAESQERWAGRREERLFAVRAPMPRKGDRPNEPPDIKVFIRNAHGKYLAQDDNGLFLTEDRSAAMIFNYRSDRVPEQLEMIQQTQGIALAADPVPPEEIYETCDRCKELFMPFMTYFDGKLFLCAECRRRAPARSARA